jgi:hypothetical protein
MPSRSSAKAALGRAGARGESRLLAVALEERVGRSAGQPTAHLLDPEPEPELSSVGYRWRQAGYAGEVEVEENTRPSEVLAALAELEFSGVLPRTELGERQAAVASADSPVAISQWVR